MHSVQHADSSSFKIVIMRTRVHSQPIEYRQSYCDVLILLGEPDTSCYGLTLSPIVPLVRQEQQCVGGQPDPQAKL